MSREGKTIWDELGGLKENDQNAWYDKVYQTKTLGFRKPEFGFVSHLICGSPIFGIQSRKELQGFMVILCLTVFRDCQSVLQNDYKSSKNARRFHFLYIPVSMCCYDFFIWSLIL